jgi:hypothetical protein
MTRYAGGLHKDSVNRMMTTLWADGKPGEEVVIAMQHNVWDFMNFLGKEYPEVVAKWIAAHGSGGKLIHVKWADKVFYVPSRTGGDKHVVTQQADRWSCVCRGYGYHGYCWAITECQGGLHPEAVNE